MTKKEKEILSKNEYRVEIREANKNTIQRTRKALNDLIDKLIENEPFWGQGNEYELCMYTTRQILEMLRPVAETLSEISPNGED